MNDDFEGLIPKMPSQCQTCPRWLEFNDLRSCFDCRDDLLRCPACHREHKADDEARDETELSPLPEEVQP